MFRTGLPDGLPGAEVGRGEEPQEKGVQVVHQYLTPEHCSLLMGTTWSMRTLCDQQGLYLLGLASSEHGWCQGSMYSTEDIGSGGHCVSTWLGWIPETWLASTWLGWPAATWLWVKGSMCIYLTRLDSWNLAGVHVIGLASSIMARAKGSMCIYLTRLDSWKFAGVYVIGLASCSMAGAMGSMCILLYIL